MSEGQPSEGQSSAPSENRRSRSEEPYPGYVSGLTADYNPPVNQRRDYAKTPGYTVSLMRFFEYAHLRPELQKISKPFGELAEWIVTNLPDNAERTVALRKLLEAKDCAVRASLP